MIPAHSSSAPPIAIPSASPAPTLVPSCAASSLFCPAAAKIVSLPPDPDCVTLPPRIPTAPVDCAAPVLDNAVDLAVDVAAVVCCDTIPVQAAPCGQQPTMPSASGKHCEFDGQHNEGMPGHWLYEDAHGFAGACAFASRG